MWRKPITKRNIGSEWRDMKRVKRGRRKKTQKGNKCKWEKPKKLTASNANI